MPKIARAAIQGFVVALPPFMAADMMVTANVRDFPSDALASYKIVAQEPYSFIYGLLDVAPESAGVSFAADQAPLLKPLLLKSNILHGAQ